MSSGGEKVYEGDENSLNNAEGDADSQVDQDDSDDEDDDSIFPWKSIIPHIAFGAFIRLALVFYGIFHDQMFQLKYTDVDYVVFTDAARYLVEGRSPFLRVGYRYTPLLAYLMVPNVILMKIFGKILFIIFDLLTGYLIYKILSNVNLPQLSESSRVTAAAIWLYNPLPLIISTRGSSDSIMTFLVLLNLYYLGKKKYFKAGVTFGFAIHFKLYPIIYAPAIYWYLSAPISPREINIFTLNPFTKKRMTFLISSAIVFLTTTWFSYHYYGKKYLEEGWLYHFTRLDTQHNFSIYFYVFRNLDQSIVYLASKLALLIQLSAVLYSLKFVIWPVRISNKSKESLYMGLLFSTFISTYLFVSLNKVITSQYFIWYFCLVPLVIPILSQKVSAKQFTIMLIIWLTSQGIWLLPAYIYEFMNRKSVLLYVWLASLFFCAVNLAIGWKLIQSYINVDLKKQQVKQE